MANLDLKPWSFWILDSISHLFGFPKDKSAHMMVQLHVADGQTQLFNNLYIFPAAAILSGLP